MNNNIEKLNNIGLQLEQIPDSKPATTAMVTKDRSFTEANKKFWKSYLEGNPKFLVLKKGSSSIDNRPIIKRFTFPKPLLSRLHTVTKELAITPFALMLSLTSSLLLRYSSQSDALVSISPLERCKIIPNDKTARYCVNLVPFRMQPQNCSVKQFLNDTGATLTQLISYAYTPLPDLLPLMGSNEYTFGPTPFSTVIVEDAMTEGEIRFQDAVGKVSNSDSPVSKYELSFFLRATESSGEFRIEADSNIYDETYIESFVNSFALVLNESLLDLEQPLLEISMITKSEQKNIVSLCRGVATDIPLDKSIYELFHAIASTYPNLKALESAGTTVSYGELETKVAKVASHLQKCGIGKGVYCLIIIPPSIDFIIAILAVLRVGGVYIPLEYDTPTERIKTLADQLQVKYGIAEKPIIQIEKIEWISTSSFEGTYYNTEQPFIDTHGEDLAYIMFTSGSTGTPKSVGVPHRAITRLVLKTNIASFTENDRFLQISNVSFDASTLEIWGALLNGGTLILCNRNVVKDPDLLRLELNKHFITAGFFTVSLFERLIAKDAHLLNGIKTLIVGGESVPTALMKKAARYLTIQNLINGYGPTENTTFSCCYRLKDINFDTSIVPIGSAINNSEVYIVDNFLNLVPFGVCGEIIVAGKGLAVGYLNNSEQNKERFIYTSRITGAPQNFYRTGDFGLMRSDGVVEYLGRRDQQVKINGYRVEIGEVESALQSLKGVERALVTFRSVNGSKQLIAFISGDYHLTPIIVLNMLRKRVPSFMIPSHIRIIQEVPRNNNGKVDFDALLQLLDSDLSSYKEPATETERQIIEICKNVLKISSVQLDKSFFDLGGNSVLIMRFRDELVSHFKVNIGVATLFQCVSVRQLARYLSFPPESTFKVRAINRAKRIKQMTHPSADFYTVI